MLREQRENIEPYETICNNHNEVIHLLKQFKETGDIWCVDQAIKLVRFCKKQGQKMEKHMAHTRSVIESLGYQRVYSTSKGKKLKSWQK